MNPLEILGVIIMALGYILVFSARAIVNKFELAKKQTIPNAYEMSEEELEAYKVNKAVFNIKKIGLLISIPGIILFIIYR